MVRFAQYFFRFLSWRLMKNAKNMLSANPTLREDKGFTAQVESLNINSLRFFAVSCTLYDSRSMFRLFKSLFEVKRISIILQCVKTTDKFTLVTNVFSRAAYLFFWLFDNLYILIKLFNVKMTKQGYKPSSEYFNKLSVYFWKMSRVCWLIGIIMFMIYCIKTLRKTYTDESDLKVGSIGRMTVNQLLENLRHISKMRKDYWLNLSRAVCDLLICLNENELPFKVLGKKINRGLEGVLGMASSLAYLYSLIKFK